MNAQRARVALVGVAAALLLLAAPSPSGASPETLQRSVQNLTMFPLDVALSPVVAVRVISTSGFGDSIVKDNISDAAQTLSTVLPLTLKKYLVPCCRLRSHCLRQTMWFVSSVCMSVIASLAPYDCHGWLNSGGIRVEK